MASTRLVVMSISKMVPAPEPETLSTAIPACVRSSARRASSTFSSTNSRSQSGEIFIELLAASYWLLADPGIGVCTFLQTRCSLVSLYQTRLAASSQSRAALSRKLLEEAHVTLIEKLNVIDSVFENRDSFHAHAPGEAVVLFRVVADEAIDVRIHHPRSENLDPPARLAHAAPSAIETSAAAALEAGNLHVSARFGEREERWIKTSSHAGTEHRFGELIECALQIAKRNVAIDCQSLYLMKDR